MIVVGLVRFVLDVFTNEPSVVHAAHNQAVQIG